MVSIHSPIQVVGPTGKYPDYELTRACINFFGNDLQSREFIEMAGTILHRSNPVLNLGEPSLDIQLYFSQANQTSTFFFKSENISA